MYSQSLRQNSRLILRELSLALNSIDDTEINRLVEAIIRADKVFVTGVGRVMISLTAWVKRLRQLGIDIYEVGNLVEPSATESSLLIAASGSGNSVIPVAHAQKAKDLGLTVCHLGSNPHGAISPFVDFMVRIPVKTRFNLPGEIPSQLPMTTLFELSLELLGDALGMRLIHDLNLQDRFNQHCAWHANIE